jgi:flagellar assembly protein FliH
MGKVVKAALFADEKYLVTVPKIEVQQQAPVSPAGDALFESHFSNEPNYDDFGSAPASAAYAPVPPPAASQVDWETVRADSEAIIDNAAADAERMIKEAEAACLNLLSQAEARATEIRDQARDAGRNEGYDAGKAEAKEELTPVIATFRELVEGVRAARAAVIAGAEPELVRLSMAIAERIVHTEVANNRNVIVENVRNALTRLVNREVVTLRLNPTDLEAIRQYRDAIIAASDVEHLRIVEDQRVDRGGVVVETEAGTIDAKIATQLREAKRALLTEDSIALDTSSGDEQLLSPSAQVS